MPESKKEQMPESPEIYPKPKQTEQEQLPTEKKIEEEVPKKSVIEEPKKQVSESVKSPHNEIHEKIEGILEEDLGDLYKELDYQTQQKFEEEGQKTVEEIETLLQKAKNHILKILKLLRRWIQIIPGINIFFVEQEARQKTKEILKLEEEYSNKKDQSTNDELSLK